MLSAGVSVTNMVVILIIVEILSFFSWRLDGLAFGVDVWTIVANNFVVNYVIIQIIIM